MGINNDLPSYERLSGKRGDNLVVVFDVSSPIVQQNSYVIAEMARNYQSVVFADRDFGYNLIIQTNIIGPDSPISVITLHNDRFQVMGFDDFDQLHAFLRILR